MRRWLSVRCNHIVRAVHLQQKPHACPLCEMRFALKQTLSRHMVAAHRMMLSQAEAVMSQAADAETQAALLADWQRSTLTLRRQVFTALRKLCCGLGCEMARGLGCELCCELSLAGL